MGGARCGAGGRSEFRIDVVVQFVQADATVGGVEIAAVKIVHILCTNIDKMCTK